MPGTPQGRPLSNLAVKTVAAAALLLVFLNAYWHAAVPGYLRGMDLCAKGCHTTRVLSPQKITHPWWCVGCHGFGVKSEIIPGLNIPLHRDHRLELQVEEYGECLMCHSVSDRLHRWHMNAEEAAKKGEKVVKCIDCHTRAYRGGHTDKPGNKACIRCHDAEAAHTGIVNKRLIANCLACHGPRPVVDAAELRKGAASYDAVASLGLVLAHEVGPSNATGCLACHNKPASVGHLRHVGKEIRLAPGVTRPVACTDCHLAQLPHGAGTPMEACTRCHHRGDTAMHDLGWGTLLADCARCHRGFRSNSTQLLPAKGCSACHHSSYLAAASTGLHASHVAAYGGCSACHDAKAKTHRGFIDSAREKGDRLCTRCHTASGGLKPEAAEGLRRPVHASGDPRHEALVERARGSCLSCHSQWHIASAPRLFYLYNETRR